LSDPIYAEPRTVEDASDCFFYHTMEIPGVGLVEGTFDLRESLDDYFGAVDFEGKRVIEVGPASGYLTFSMEARGADVVVIETSEEFTWDAVPYDLPLLETWGTELLPYMQKLRNSFWFTHRRLNSKARVHYGSGYSLPDELGRFDVGLMSCVLLHTRDPLAIIRNCAALVDERLVIIDIYNEELDQSGIPAMTFCPRRDNEMVHTWWHLSPAMLREYAAILGFEEVHFSRHVQRFAPVQGGETEPQEQFTMVLERKRPWRPIPRRS